MYYKIKNYFSQIVIAIATIAIVYVMGIDAIIAKGCVFLDVIEKDPAIAVATLALLLTIWQGWQTRRHNRLSVRPSLEQFVTMNIRDGAEYYEFKLINKGVGPAVIKEWVLSFEGKEVSRGNARTYNEFWFEKIDKFANAKAGFIAPNNVMEKGEERLMWSFNYDSKTDDIRFIHKVDLWIRYESMYGVKSFFYDSKDSRQFNSK